MCKALRIAMVIISVLLFCSTVHAEANASHEYRLLFVGNSLTYMNDVPSMVRAIYSVASNQQVETPELVAQGGFSIADHLAGEAFASALSGNQFDAVVLQDFGGWPLCSSDLPSCSQTSEPLSEAAQKVRRAGARPIWYATYHVHPEAQRALSKEVEGISKELGLEVADVGGALQIFAQANPGVELFIADGHLSPMGSVVAAATIARAILGFDLPKSITRDSICPKRLQFEPTLDERASDSSSVLSACNGISSELFHAGIMAANKSLNPDALKCAP